MTILWNSKMCKKINFHTQEPEMIFMKFGEIKHDGFVPAVSREK